MGTKTFGGGTAAFVGDTGSPIDSLIVLKVQFRDPTTSTEGPGDKIAVTSPTVRILHASRPISVSAIGSAEQPDSHAYPLNPNVPAQTGLYRFSFLTNGLKAGLYDLEFTGQATLSDDTTTTLLVPGQIGLGTVSYLDSLMNRLSIALGDDRPDLYQLDGPFHQWNADQLYVFLIESLSTFNAAGPRFTQYSLGEFPQVIDHLLIAGARIQALYSRARLEKSNELIGGDGHTPDIKRADSYFQFAQRHETIWLQQIKDWKLATPPRVIGLRNQTMPFRISRVIGLLNNFQTFFSG